MKQVNFFILGAPKCGTTSLARWLSEHPRVFMSERKEPNFFNRDFEWPGRVASLEEYDELFEQAGERHTVVGEATTGYLRSARAVQAILDYATEPKFLVALRNPLALVPSLHAQRIREGLETELSLERAWEIQDERARGRGVPATCPDPQWLHYGRFGLLGEQLQRLLAAVPRERVLVVLLEDLQRDPRAEYRSLLAFLGVPDDERDEFPVVNPRQMPRSAKLAQALRLGGAWKRRLGISWDLRLAPVVAAWNARRAETPVVSEVMRETLVSYYRDDVQRLSELLERDLTHWLAVD